MVTTTTYGDNKYQPGVTFDQYTPDQLIAGDYPLETQPIILSGGAALKRGTVLGLVSTQSITAAAASTNTGNGTVGSLTKAPGSKIGAYQLVATSATNFTVTDPEGASLPAATVGTAYSQQGVGFTISAGGTSFAAGDKFTLNSLDATGQYKQAVASASDGSQNPVAILVDDADASAGPVPAGAYLTGEFNSRRIIFDASFTVATLRGPLRALSIFLKSNVAADEPTN